VLDSSRFACLTAIAGQIIYYLTRGVPGVRLHGTSATIAARVASAILLLKKKSIWVFIPATYNFKIQVREASILSLGPLQTFAPPASILS
jgi:hypothetical protein